MVEDESIEHGSQDGIVLGRFESLRLDCIPQRVTLDLNGRLRFRFLMSAESEY